MLLRWLKFNTVGAIGIGVQLAALVVFRSLFGLQYLLATALAVETAVLHNFVWHERWTWRDRATGHWLGRLLRFHLGNGLVSIGANLLLMRLFVGHFHLHYLLANILSIAICAIANFIVSERFVFTPR